MSARNGQTHGVRLRTDEERRQWKRERDRQRTAALTPEQLRAINYRRRNARRHHDITPAYEAKLRAKAKRCPLCKVRLIEEPFQPASKELDHIIPIVVGGTHTIGNVRIICRLCNQKRPKDGSDVVGQVTLWAQDPSVAPRVVQLKAQPKPKPVRTFICRYCGQTGTGSGKHRQTCGAPACKAQRASERERFPKRACEICGADYHPNYPHQRTCGSSCGQRMRHREGRGINPPHRSRTQAAFNSVLLF